MADPSRRQWLRAALGAAALGSAGSALRAGGEVKLKACLYHSEELGRYGFLRDHPLGVDRQGAFFAEATARGLDREVRVLPPRKATRAEIERFHTPTYVDKVERAEAEGLEVLDYGDTPVFPGVYEISATVVGGALDGLHRIMTGETLHTFQPIGGLHHARPDRAAGFCVFNDLGVVIKTLRSEYGVKRVAYVDIDVHHGDGVFYPFEDDPELIFCDIHEDGRHLYPGTGHAHETGKGAAKGTKLNIPLPPGAGDKAFLEAWPRVVAHLRKFEPQFVVFQCGADGLDGDPLAHLTYSAQVHAHAARSLVHFARQHCGRRVMAFGGGGYNRRNLAQAWSEVLRELAVPAE